MWLTNHHSSGSCSASDAAGGYDPSEPFSPSSARHPRLKGGVPAGTADPGALRQRVSLPDRWLVGRHSDDGPPAGLPLDDDACEG